MSKRDLQTGALVLGLFIAGMLVIGLPTTVTMLQWDSYYFGVLYGIGLSTMSYYVWQFLKTGKESESRRLVYYAVTMLLIAAAVTLYFVVFDVNNPADLLREE